MDDQRPHWDDTSTGVSPRKTAEEKSTGTTYGGLAGGRIFTENNRPDPAHETRAFDVAKTVTHASRYGCSASVAVACIQALEIHVKEIKQELGALETSLRMFKERFL